MFNIIIIIIIIIRLAIQLSFNCCTKQVCVSVSVTELSCGVLNFCIIAAEPFISATPLLVCLYKLSKTLFRH